MPATPTVSMCAFRSRVFPPPEPRAIPTALKRPGATSSTSTSSPAPSSQRATKRAISPSPARALDQVGVDRVDADEVREELRERPGTASY